MGRKGLVRGVVVVAAWIAGAMSLQLGGCTIDDTLLSNVVNAVLEAVLTSLESSSS
jgi:hypothetical protein